MSNEEKKKITICLEESKYAHGFGKDQNIHIVEYERVKGLIKKQIEKVEKLQQNNSTFGLVRQHNTISIFGGRGSGKTTFIYSMLKQLSDEEKNAEILGIIDPTQMEQKEHIFLVVLSLINDKIKEKLDMLRNSNKGDVCCYERQWNNQLRKLAKGLPTLDSVELPKYDNWDDDTFIIERGLDNVSSAYNLEANFHKLVSQALSILGKEFFVLAFDDIDVEMSKGWLVLETIRKYLTTPKLITLLSGNLTLYSYNVRLQQWKQLRELKEFEEINLTSQINQLEGQYMLKLFKPENRVQLMSLLEAKQRYGISYFIKKTSQDGGKKEEIEDIYRNYLEKLRVYGRSTQQDFIDYLLGLSIRSQISILSNINDDDIYSQIEAFVSRMMAAQIDMDAAINNAAFVVITIARYLASNNLFSYSYLLVPNIDDHDINGCLMGLTLIFNNQANTHTWILLDYMLRIGYTRKFYQSLNKEMFQRVLSYSGLLQDVSIKNVVALMIAVGKASDIRLRELIPIKGLAIKAKKGQESKKGLLDSVLESESINIAQKRLALLPLISLSSSKQDSTELFYSVPVLLSAICHIVRWGEEDTDMKDCLSDLSQLKTYPMPLTEYGETNIKKGDISTNEDLSSSLKLEDEESKDKSFNELVRTLKEWRTLAEQEKFAVPPYLLGRIMTRFTDAVENIGDFSNLGEAMQQMVIVFLNTCLVEEVKEYTKNVNISNNNPTGSTKLFEDNLGKIKKEEGWQQLKLTRWLITCPLFYCFMKQDLSEKISVGNFVPEEDFLLYDILQNVSIKGTNINKLVIKGNNYAESFKLILSKGVTLKEFEDNFYEKDNEAAKEWLESKDFVDSITEKGIKCLRSHFEKRKEREGKRRRKNGRTAARRNKSDD